MYVLKTVWGDWSITTNKNDELAKLNTILGRFRLVANTFPEDEQWTVVGSNLSEE